MVEHVDLLFSHYLPIFAMIRNVLVYIYIYIYYPSVRLSTFIMKVGHAEVAVLAVAGDRMVTGSASSLMRLWTIAAGPESVLTFPLLT